MSRIVVGAVIAVVVLVGIVFGAQVYFETSTIQPQIDARKAEIAEHHDRFLEDVRALKNHPFFTQNRGEKNAASFLADKIGWGSGENVKDKKFLIPDEITRKLVGFPDALADEDAVQKAAARLDFSWLKDLRAFGHWEFDGTGSYVSGERILPWTADLPNFIPLRNWARLHLFNGHFQAHGVLATEPPDERGDQGVEGRKEGEENKESNQKQVFFDAVDDVRHLAALCISTETIIGEMMGVAILEEAEKALSLWGPKDAERLATEEDLERMKRSFFAVAAYMSPYSTAQMHAEVIKEGAGWPGLCAGATEATAWFLPLVPMLEGRFPGHADRLTQTVSEDIPGCRLKLARRFLDQFTPGTWSLRDSLQLMNQSPNSAVDGQAALPLSWQIGVMIPGVPRLMGGILSEIAMPAWFGRYKQKSPQ
jgi:hypothetical protein